MGLVGLAIAWGIGALMSIWLSIAHPESDSAIAQVTARKARCDRPTRRSPKIDNGDGVQIFTAGLTVDVCGERLAIGQPHGK